MTVQGERRRNDRRRSDRRQGRRRDDGLPDLDTGSSEPFFDPGWLAAGDVAPDSRWLLLQARRAAAIQDSALARVFRTYTAARAAVGVGLVGLQAAATMAGSPTTEPMIFVSLAYAVQAVTLWLLPRFRPLVQGTGGRAQRRRQWTATIGVDLLAFMLLHLLEVRSTFNFAALLVLPVLMAGVLTSRLVALGTAAGTALLLLAIAWRASSGDAGAGALILQSGLAGIGLFLITLMAAELAGRLAREEVAARGSLELARQQAQLNRLVIEEMVDGVLVVDRRLRVRAANPAARALLVAEGLSPPAPFGLGDRPAWSALEADVARAFADGRWPDAGRDVALVLGEGHVRTLRVRVRFMRGPMFGAEAARAAPAQPEADHEDLPAGESFVVLLLEDLRTAMARVQQEKLAAMGRVSAGIAHEIRNPLAAISQANALLMEDELSPAQQRLARMVADNVERLKRLVDDVMEVAPGPVAGDRAIDVRAAVAATAAEWAATAQLALGPESRLRVDIAPPAAGAVRTAPTPPGLGAIFDPEHLRRVLVNLLDNAHRHASAAPGSILIELTEVGDAAAVQLSVRSDGEPIPPEVERFLFEPFFSTRSRGSGLGLYICRELCERYGASIEYRLRPAAERWRNEFVVTMRRAALAEGPAALPLLP